MAGIRVKPNIKVLRSAVERSPKELRSKFKQLDRWLAGQEPTLRQLEEFAKAAAVPFGFLFLQNLPEDQLPIPHFRTLIGETRQRPSPELLETVHTMQRRQAWMREYLISEGYEPLPYVGSARVDGDPLKVARRIWETLDIPLTWAAEQPNWTSALMTLRQKAESAGILVASNSIVGTNSKRPLTVEEFRGFVLVDEYAPLVFLNSRDGKAAQMFTLAHELAHVWLGRSASFDLRDLQPANDKIEQACNRIAAEFLVPSEELRQFWRESGQNDAPFQAVARQFRVSEIVAARRTLDLGLISKETFFTFYNEYQSRERSDKKGKEGGDFYATSTLRLGRRFSEAVIRAVRKERLLYSEAFRLTGLYGRTFDRYMDSFLKSRA